MNIKHPTVLASNYLLLFILLFSSQLHSQAFHFGMPLSEMYSYPIENFTAITHDQHSVIFSADHKIVQFNGYYSTLVETKQNISSLHYGDSTLYYGSDNTYGTVLLDGVDYKLDGYFTEADDQVHKIVSSNYGNFILANNTIYHFQEAVAKKYSFPGIVDYLGNVNNSVILHDDTNGLSIFVGGRFKIVNNSRFLSTMQVVSINSLGSGEYMVATKNNGLFRSDGETLYPFGKEYLQDKSILDLEILYTEEGREEIIVITDRNELISLDFSGTIIAEKLYSHALLGLHKDEDNKLYVISSNGIEVFFYNMPMEVVDLSPDPLHGPITIHDEKLYWGTNNGLFYARILENNNLSDGRIRVKDTEGKVGKLDVVQNTLLMSHEDGLYDILPRIGARFIPDERFYDFKELKNNYLLGFSDRNTYLLKLIRNRWRVVKTLEDLPIHPKSVVFTNDEDLWLVDRDYNLLQYQFDFDDNTASLINTTRNQDKTQVFGLDSTVIMIKKEGVFRFDTKSETFEISDDLTAIFGKNLNINELVTDQYDNIWYIQNGQVGIFRAQEINNKRQYKKLSIHYPNETARSIYPYDKNNIFINNGDHYINLNLEEYKQTHTENPFIERITKSSSNGKQTTMYNAQSIMNSLEDFIIKPQDNLTIYMGGKLSPASTFEYSLTQKGESDNWQVSPTKSVLNLQGIQYGEYSVRIRNRSYNGLSDPVSFHLDVNRGLWEGNSKYYVLGIAAFLLMGISLLLGITIGERKAYRDKKRRK